MITWVKICCIGSVEEAKMAIQSGASALGLVAKMPGGPGVISDKLIIKIARSVPPAISTFLLTSETSADEIIEHHKRTFTTAIQLVDELKQGSHEEIKRALKLVEDPPLIQINAQFIREDDLGAFRAVRILYRHLA